MAFILELNSKQEKENKVEVGQTCWVSELCTVHPVKDIFVVIYQSEP